MKQKTIDGVTNKQKTIDDVTWRRAPQVSSFVITRTRLTSKCYKRHNWRPSAWGRQRADPAFEDKTWMKQLRKATAASRKQSMLKKDSRVTADNSIAFFRWPFGHWPSFFSITEKMEVESVIAILSVIQKCPEMKKWQKVSTLQRPQKPWSWILKLLLSAIICEPDKLESQWRYPRMRKTGLSDGLKKCLIIWKFREKRLFLRFLANFRHLPTISVTNTC